MKVYIKEEYFSSFFPHRNTTISGFIQIFFILFGNTSKNLDLVFHYLYFNKTWRQIGQFCSKEKRKRSRTISLGLGFYGIVWYFLTFFFQLSNKFSSNLFSNSFFPNHGTVNKKFRAKVLILQRKTSKNGQAHFKNLAANAARFLKFVWPFWSDHLSVFFQSFDVQMHFPVIWTSYFFKISPTKVRYGTALRDNAAKDLDIDKT